MCVFPLLLQLALADTYLGSLSLKNLSSKARRAPCPVWVKNGSRGLAAGCLLWPQKRKSIVDGPRGVAVTT
jgi:hypothetical protein